MSFNDKEQEIIKYGVANGKSRQEVEQAIANYRAGIVTKKKVETTLTSTEPSLGSKILERGKTALSEATLKPSRDILVEGANTTGQEREIIGLEAFNRAFQAPARVAMAAGGAVGDIVGAGLKATGADKVIAGATAPLVKPVVQSEGARKLVENFNKLPKDTQEYLKGIPDIANLLGLEIIPGSIAKMSAKTALKSPLNTTAFDAIKGSSGNLTQKALDFISNDPGAKVETILKRATPEELDNYLAIAEKSAQSGEAKSVFEAVGDKMAETTKTLKTKLDGIGAAKSEVMKKNGNIDFTSQTSPLISQLEDIMKSFTEIDKAQAPIVEKFIADAKNIKTAAQADTFIDKAQDALYTSDRTMVLPSGSALEKRLQKIIGEYNSSLKKAVPAEYASLNEQYAKLVEALSTINKSLGDTFEGVPLRGSGLIKQYFSPAGSKTKEIFEFIKKETNGEVDLAKDATLAKFAGQLFDDPNVNSLLGGIKDIPTTASAVVGKVIEKVGGEKATSLLRQSTIRKAKSSTTPKESKVTSVVERKTPTEVKVLPSTESTTNSTASKGDNFERAPGLTPQNKTIENKAFEKILNNESKLLKAYKVKYGNEVNADNFRPFFKDVGYNGSNAAAVQEPSSYLAKKAYADALTNKGEYATFSAGGSGAGKSSGIKAISELSDLKNKSAVLLDSNLSSYSSAIKKIKQAEAAGKEFKGIYTYRDPVDSFVNGVVKRMNDNPEEMGRIVPTKVMAGNHIDSLEVVKKLIKDGYSFRIVDNSLGAGKAKLTTLEDIVQKAKYPSVQELTGILNREAKKLLDKGVITKNQYEEYIK